MTEEGMMGVDERGSGSARKAGRGQDLFSLEGKVAIVTGASSGIGVQIGSALREAGATVVLVARRREVLETVSGELECEFMVADVTSDGDRLQLIESTVTRFGSVDVLVNNAGVASTRPAEEETASGFRHVLETNLVAPFELARLAGVHMLERGSGSIVNIASTLGLVGNPRIPDVAYASSKGGLVLLTRELAAQWAAPWRSRQCHCARLFRDGDDDINVRQ